MFKLPKQCEVNKFIPKKVFYENLGITTKTKNEFIDIVEKITWKYKLAESTLGVNKTAQIEEIQIFEITLKIKTIPKNIIKVITKGVEYPILFVIKYQDDIAFAINDEKIYVSDWNEQLAFAFQGITLAIIYENIIKTIIGEQNNSKKLAEIIILKNQKDELTKKIAQLENKLKKEKQFNKKVELNRRLKILLKELENLEA
jgi:hypothetical protein